MIRIESNYAFLNPTQVVDTSKIKEPSEVIDEGGQPSLFLLDLKGKEYPAIAEVNRKKRVNGQREISLSFLYDQINQDFLHDIEFGWKILFKGEWYTITGPTYSLDGDLFSVGVDAVLSFFVDMNGHYLQDEVEDKSMTPANYYRELFEGTGYSFVLVDNLLANTLNYQANQSKTERFLYGTDRFEGEYKIQGKTAYIHGLIGSDKDVILHEDLNIQDVSIEVDASGFHTWARGFGDKDEGIEDAEYQLETEEFIQGLVDKHGWIEGPAIRDGSYKHETALKEALTRQIENSFKISTTITAVDLTNNGYPEMQFEEGDRVWLFVTQLNQNQQVRVVEIDETFNWEGNITAVQYVLGNEGIAARYKTQQYSTLSDFRDIQSGRKTLEFNWLPEAIRRASDIINGNIDSHFSYRAGEIIGINRSNPNGYMRFNTDGIGFSRDGGSTYRTAITYEGIVADAITAGTLRGILIEGVEIYGGTITQESGNRKLVMSNGELRSYYNDDVTMKFGQYKMSFHNRDQAEIGSFYPITSLTSGEKGIGFEVTDNSHFGIGVNKSGIMYPSISIIPRENRMYVAGPYNSANSGSLLALYANRRFLSANPTGNWDMLNSIDQPAIILDQSNTSNDVFLYYGGFNRRAGAQANFRTRLSDSSYRDILELTQTGLRVRTDYLRIGESGSGDPVFRANAIRRRTSTNDANVRINPDSDSNGLMYRTTSSEKAKINIEEITIEHALKVLDVMPVTWFEKENAEMFCDFLNGENQELGDIERIKRIPGITAENVENAGLTEFVERVDDEIVNVNNKLWVLLIPIVKNILQEMEGLKNGK